MKWKDLTQEDRMVISTMKDLFEADKLIGDLLLGMATKILPQAMIVFTRAQAVKFTESGDQMMGTLSEEHKAVVQKLTDQFLKDTRPVKANHN